MERIQQFLSKLSLTREIYGCIIAMHARYEHMYVVRKLNISEVSAILGEHRFSSPFQKCIKLFLHVNITLFLLYVQAHLSPS